MNLARSVSIVVTSLLLATSAFAQTRVEVVSVVSKPVERQVKLPGEFQPYLAVPIVAKVSGFVKRVNVDRGSAVKHGQILATLEAPEMQAQIVEAQSKAQALELQRTEAEAKLAAAQSTYDRLKAASATPGVVAENDVVVAQKNAEAAQALVRSYENSMKAAQAQVQAVKDLGQYLQIKAPFDGVITERNVHPGALVGPGSGTTPLFRLHQVSRLRLVVPVPEALVGAIVRGARVPFTVPAFPGETFNGVISLVAHDLDPKTRTMAVELEVKNLDFKLAPGMYPEVSWPVRRPQPSLLVPPTSIVTTTERTFVIRVKDGAAEWVNVGRGARIGDLVEVFGPLKSGDQVVRRGSDEIREGTKVQVTSPANASPPKSPSVVRSVSPLSEIQKPPTVLFVCPHGAAKSVLASAYFQRVAKERGLNVRVVAVGVEPQNTVSPAVAEHLQHNGYTVPVTKPRAVTKADLDKADVVISMGCDVTHLPAAPRALQQWDDIPGPSEDFNGADEAIRRRVIALVEELVAHQRQ